MPNRENLHRIKQESPRREQMEELRKFFTAHRDVQFAVPRDLAAQLMPGTSINALSSHTNELLAEARRLTRNEVDARDLVQDTFVRALETLQRSEQPPENMRAWLRVVMRHAWFNVVRHQRVCAKRARELANDDMVDSGLCDTRALTDQFARAWSRISTQAQRIAVQCLLQGDSQEEVSRALGMTPGGVAASIHRTREHLRESMFER